MATSRLATIPTPMAGLALGIASLGGCWEFSGLTSGQAKIGGALIAACLLIMLALRFARHPATLLADLKHPVVGSVAPTFAMASMVVSAALPSPAREVIWLLAVALHLGFLAIFTRHRLKGFRLSHMVPSWFVPPVGIIVADVTSPGGALAPLAEVLFWFGLIAYGIMLPFMLYRLIFNEDVPDAAKPTIAILAAPASLSLAGYLTIFETPNPLIVAVLLGIAVLMTAIIYLAFFKLMRLPFSPGYAAFTFPMVIGSTALFKTHAQLSVWGLDATSLSVVETLAQLELAIATVVVSYVALRYAYFYAGRAMSPPAKVA